ncbi:hypothetical protein IAU60_002258 [Kwoniella sp. DSM 27419]
MPSAPSQSEARPHLSTSHAYFLQTNPTRGGPPVALLLRGVNLSSTSKYPTLPQSLTDYEDVASTSSRKARDVKRRTLAGQETHLGEDQVRLFSEGEEGGRDGWYVGRPFPEQDADIHLRRLKAWGFTTIRYIVPWEALEHAGPGKYDEAYIDYTITMLKKCREHGLRVFISPHQDAFSRFISGSGAPYWVLVALGINPRRIHQTGAGLLHQCYSKEGFGGEEGIDQALNGKLDEWPDMIWNTNLHRLAARHCFAMFFASNHYAPKCTIDGLPVRDYLQQHYLAAYGHLADRLRDAGDILDDCLIGWDSMNEPHQGFIGIPDLDTFPEAQNFKKGPSPTPIQGFRLGVGEQVHDIELSDFTSTGQKNRGKVTLTPPGGKGLWLTREEAKQAGVRWGWRWGDEWDFWDELGEGGCPWAGHGVWDTKTGKTLRPDYFLKVDGEEADFIEDFWKPFFEAFIGRIRESHPNAISFINPPIFEKPPALAETVKAGRMALSSHFYDGLTMLGKRRHVYNADAVGLQRGLTNILSAIKIGTKSIKNTLRHQLGELKSDAHDNSSLATDDEGGDYPTLIGEIGTPWDMKETKLLGLAKGKANRKDYKEPAKAMDQLMNACDGHNALSYTLWAYEPLSTHELGDGWNGEDLSLISYDDATWSSSEQDPVEDEDDLDLQVLNPPDLKTLIRLGSRGIESWCRPYPAETVANIDKFRFAMKDGEFSLSLKIHGLECADIWANELHNRDKNVDKATDKADVKISEGYTKIYLPYVHYLHQGTLNVENSVEKNRVLGAPDEGEMEWQAGQGAARVDIEVVEITEGRLEVKGQWGWWYYPLEQDKGERGARLTIRPWGGR